MELIAEKYAYFNFEPVAAFYLLFTRKGKNEKKTKQSDLEIEKYDPLNWKNHNHYKILDLENLRYKATQEQIKGAYKRLILIHHPDKNRGKDDNFFKCIQKSFEILSDEDRRQQYDSIDFDESIPDANQTFASHEEFFQKYGKVFSRNARFSKNQPVPKLGDMTASREEVNEFYRFWNFFESWRRFEYLDEESKEDAENREERRWIDRKNRSQRLKRKTEDNTRISRLTSQASKLDPRIAFWKEEDRKEKARKEQEKLDKQKELSRIREQLDLEEKARKQRIEAEERFKINEIQRRKQAEKEKFDSEKRKLKETIKNNEYFTKDIGKIEPCLVAIEIMASRMTINDIQQVNESLDSMICNDEISHDQIYDFIIENAEKIQGSSLNSSLSHHQNHHQHRQQGKNKQEESNRKEKEEEDDGDYGTVDNQEIVLLVDACKVYPGGTLNRWQVITEFMNKRTGKNRNQSQVLRMSEDLKRGKLLKGKATTDATIPIPTPTNIATTNTPTANNDNDNDKNGKTDTVASSSNITDKVEGSNESSSASTAWSIEEQKKLESALKMFPQSDPERWNSIAAHVGRTKKECITRVKLIVSKLGKNK